MAVQYPSLTAEGFVKDPQRIAAMLMTNALASDASQSNLYRGAVTSIQSIIQKTGQDVRAMTQMLQNELENMYRRYFDQASFEVRIEPLSAEKPNTLNIKLEGKIVSDGVRYDLGRALMVNEGVIQKVIPINYRRTS